MPLDAAAVELVFRTLDREVWVVTSAHAGRRGGLLATWVSQASIDSQCPMIVAGLAPNHFTAELVAASGNLAVHLLRADQADVALNFALGSGRDCDKLSGLEVVPSATGAPRLADCQAWLDCRVQTTFELGDRRFFVADVVAGATVRPGGSVLREQGLLAAATDDQKGLLRANLEHDIHQLRLANRRWHEAVALATRRR